MSLDLLTLGTYLGIVIGLMLVPGMFIYLRGYSFTEDESEKTNGGGSN